MPTLPCRALVALLPLGFILWSSSARAELRAGDTVVVDRSEVIDGNLYANGGTVAIRGTVRGDVVVAGGTVLLDGVVEGDVLAAGGQVSVSGRVEGDVRAAGGQVSLLAPAGGDAVLAGGDVQVGAPVAGDALLAGGTVLVSGPVGGALYGGAGEARVDAPVSGDVLMQSGAFVLGERAQIAGDVHYTGPRVLEREPGATVDGVVTQRRGPEERSGVGAFLYGWLQLLTGLFVLGLIFVLVFRGFAERSLHTLAARPWLSLGIGLAVLLGVPLAMLLVLGLGALVGGAWLAFLGMAVYGVAVALAFPLIAAFLGMATVRRLKRTSTPLSWWPMLLGLVALTLLSFVPLLGPLVMLATLLFGLGALAVTLVPTLRFTRTPTVETAPLPSTSAAATRASLHHPR